MNKKRMFQVVLVLCCLVVAFIYSNKSKEETKKQENENNVENYQTVIFKDNTDTLIPVDVDLGIEGEVDQVYRNMMTIMQSSQFEDLGLFPVFSEDLAINSLDVNDHVLTIDFSNNFHITNNKEALDILESLAYVYCNDDITNINLLVDGKSVSTLPDSTMPTTCLSNELGLNNFESDTLNIYKTIPVTVYNQKEINNQTYFVPTTLRIEANQHDLNTQVMMILDQIHSDQQLELLEEVAIYEGVLSVNLSSNILLDNETIDESLYQQIQSSLSSLEGVNTVSVLVDGQEIELAVSKTFSNRIKL